MVFHLFRNQIYFFSSSYMLGFGNTEVSRDMAPDLMKYTVN